MMTYNYAWRGTNAIGHIVQGNIQAENKLIAKALLRRQDITTTSIKRKIDGLNITSFFPAKAKHIALFIRQIATLITAGLPLLIALNISQSTQTQPEIKKLIDNIKNDISSGKPLSQSLAKHHQHFNAMSVHLLTIGEETGELDSLLNHLADLMEKKEKLKNQIKQALFYPLFVIIFSIAITMGLLTFIVPQFEQLFAHLQTPLPMLTRYLITLSQKSHVFLGVTIGAIFGIIAISKIARSLSANLRFQLDKLLFCIPLIKPLLANHAHASFSYTLSLCLQAEVPIHRIIDMLVKSTANLYYQQGIAAMKHDINAGQKLSTAMKNSQLFPSMMVQMVHVGEESGSLDQMLLRTSRYYQQALDNKIKQLTQLIEPCMLVVLSIIVGGLIMGLYLPIFQLGGIM